MFTKSNPAVGSRPGTLAIPAGSPPPRITVVQYDAAGVERREIRSDAELRALRDSERVTWVDVQGLGSEPTLRALAEVFAIQPLALENAVNVPQRAKTEVYENHQLVIARAPLWSDERVLMPQVCFILGARTLLTFQERSFGFFDPVRRRLEEGVGPIREEGPDYLCYALIDAMVDRYYPVAQQLSDRVEELEEWVVENPHPEVLARIHGARRQLAVLRRVGRPQREALGEMIRADTPFVTDRVKGFLRDTHDHMAQIVELVDSMREMASDLAEAYLSNVSHRTNEVMKVLTLMASIFIPLSFVAGVYGMNFDNMPELHTRYGYFLVMALLIAVAVGMTLYFRRRGWLGTPPPPSFESDRPE